MRKTEDNDDDIVIIPSKGNAYLDPSKITGIGTESMGRKDVENTGTLDGKKAQTREERESEASKTLSLGTQLKKDMEKDPVEKQAAFFGKNLKTSNPYFPKAEKNTTRSPRGDGPQTKLRPSKKKFSAFGQMNVKTALGGIPQIGPFGGGNSSQRKFLKGLGFSGAFPLMNYRDWGTGDKQFWGADMTEEEDES